MADNTVNTSTSSTSVQSQSPPRRLSPRKRDATDIPGGSGTNIKVPRGAISDTKAPQELQGPNIKTLRIVAVKLQSHLKREDVSDLGYLMEFPETFDQSLQKASNPVRFFIKEAEKLGKISDQNFDLLIEVLKTLKLQAASRAVEECKAGFQGDNIVPKENEGKVNPLLTKQEKASKTANSHWKLFEVWSKNNKVNDPKKASCAKISNYLKHLYHNKGLKVASIRGHLKSITLFHEGFDDNPKLKLTLKYLALTEKASRSKSGNNT